LPTNPELVGRFVRATLKGWQRLSSTRKKPGQSLPNGSRRNVAYHTTALNLLVPLVDTSETPIGWIEEPAGSGYGKRRGYTAPGLNMEFVKSAQP
jgi:hypothetical protein